MEQTNGTIKKSKTEKVEASAVITGWRKKTWLLTLLLGVLVGIAGFIVYRAAVAKSPFVHYHANFGVFINGEQQKFAGPGYYEEVTTCNVHNADDVKSRAHMHDNINHVVHVHDHGVTWGDFFNNIGYTVGDKVISDGSNVYVDGQDGNALTFMLNGQRVTTVADLVIKSEDVLLVNYGADNDQALQQHYAAIPKDAHHYNVTADPAACSGGDKFDMKARLKEALGLQLTAH